ncbi:outer membrane protein transport protein [Jiella sp. MQZ9-1]|uniref:Outer membrane protein transport protein n=1 Tax=Jiella flava TaxID=2816857 RepID=A0A939FXN6_9HYPH|nr:outer membrane protein transport protein [Jiella flava]MBO0662784.1 outer membrane protein transport protein [Jiella flava]MCD2471205.1 outer membrane protein transport protein [Jiella flava]
MGLARKRISIAALVVALSGSSALAGGFQRGTADTDILFEPGTVNSRASITYIDPQRGFTSLNGVDGDYSTYTGDYGIPSYAVAVGNDMIGCAGTATEPFAANADYSGLPGGALPAQVSSTQSMSTADRTNFAAASSIARVQKLSFKSSEFGLTCRLSYTSGSSRYSLLGGAFVEDFHFEGTSLGSTYLAPGVPFTVATSRIDVESDGAYKPGFRIGAAYEIPEYALRIQAMYRSEVKHDDISGDGTVTILSSLVPTLPAGTVIPVNSFLSEAISPQSVEIKAQTGIAPGWLVLGSFRWTDWSTNQVSVSSISNAAAGISSSSYAPYHWRDGYTAQIGVGHAFTDQISAALGVGYDRGVSTGSETTYTDLYTLVGGLSYKPAKAVDIRFGGVVGYWTDGSQSISKGSYYNATVGNDMVYGLNASLKISF